MLTPVGSVLLASAAAVPAAARRSPRRPTLRRRKQADQVVVAAADGRGPPTKWTGEILDYTGHELRLRLAERARKDVSGRARRGGIDDRSAPSSRPAIPLGPRAIFAAHWGIIARPSRVKHETREWVRRQILAQIVWCYKSLGEWEPACDYFLILLARDRTTQYFDCLPLAWLPEEPSPTLERKGERVAGPGRDAGRHVAGGEPLAADGRSAGGAGGACAVVDRSGPADRPVGPSPGVADGGLSGDRQAMRRLAASRSRKCPKRCVPGPTSSSARPWSAGIRKRDAVAFARGDLVSARAAGGCRRRWPAPPPRSTNWIAASEAQVAVGRDHPVVSRPGAGWPKRPRSIWATAAVRLDATPPRDENHEPADQRFLAGLRRRGLFALAETYCRERLEDAAIGRSRPGGTGHRSGAHAGRTRAGGAGRQPRTDLAGNLDHHRRFPAAASAESPCLAGADASRPGPARPGGTGAARSRDRRRARLIRSTTCGPRSARRSSSSNSSTTIWPAKFAAARGRSDRRPACWAMPNWRRSKRTSRYQLARGFRNQALAYPADSNDRLNAFTQAIELLGPLAKSPDDDPLAWPSRVEEIVCLRQVGQLAEATRRARPNWKRANRRALSAPLAGRSDPAAGGQRAVGRSAGGRRRGRR